MAFNIGLNVVEVDGRMAPAIVAAPLSIAGFLVRSPRGVANQPVHIMGMAEFNANFGGFSADAFGAHAVRGFFENGGTEAYVVRIAGAGAVPASVNLLDRAAAPSPSLRVAAGQGGREDPGTWSNDLRIQVTDHPLGTSFLPAQIISANLEPFDLNSGWTLVVTVNGATSPVTITFNNADFASIDASTAAEVAAAINRQTTGLSASVSPDRRLLLASATTGAASHLAVAGTAATALGFTGGTGNSNNALPATATMAAVASVAGFTSGSAVRIETRGHIIGTAAVAAALPATPGIQITANGGTPVVVTFTDADFVRGLSNVDAGEVVAAINRRAIGFSAALNQQGRLVLLSNRFGSGSTIAIAAPPAITDATTALGLTGAAAVPGVREIRELAAVSEQGKWVSWNGGLPVGGLAANAARIQSAEFDLVVSRNGRELERFETLSMQPALNYYAPAVINDPDRGSRWITVTDLLSTSSAGEDVPAVGDFALNAASAGNDGGMPTEIQYIGDPSNGTGLYAFDTVRLQLLACPETTSPGVVAACLSYCEGRGDMMFVGVPPRGLDLEGIKTYANAFRGRKVYGALYAPWIQIVNPLDTTGANPRLWIPPVGHILGAYARIADTRGVWKAPAGDEANLRGALDVEFDMTDVDHTDLVRNASVNGIRAIPGSGIIIDASRTLSTDTRWWYVGTRRLFNFVKVSLRDGLRWVSQEVHSEELRRKVKFNTITPFLLGLWRQGAFGSDAPELVFTVICDASNNPPTEVNLGYFRAEIYFYVTKPAETIILIVGQQESGASAAEA